MSQVSTWTQTKVLFGGAFDPPHLGHLDAARGLLQNPGVGKVIILPAGNPPGKSSVTPAHHRLKMVQLCFGSEFEIDQREIKTPSSETNPNYTAKTLRTYQTEANDLAFACGTDQLYHFHRWKDFPELLELCHWIFLIRHEDGFEYQSLLTPARNVIARWEKEGLVEVSDTQDTWLSRKNGRRITLVPTEAKDLASTRVRRALNESREVPPQTLSDKVQSYILQNNLYGSPTE